MTNSLGGYAGTFVSRQGVAFAKQFVACFSSAVVLTLQVKKLFPSARQLTNTWHSVVKIQQSLYREAPGLDPFRPDQKTPVPNFFLAGSYTKQDYIDSMEGATLSGRQCAAAVLEAAPALAQSRPPAVSRAAVAEPVPA